VRERICSGGVQNQTLLNLRPPTETSTPIKPQTPHPGPAVAEAEEEECEGPAKSGAVGNVPPTPFTPNPKPVNLTSTPKPETRNLKPETRNPKHTKREAPFFFFFFFFFTLVTGPGRSLSLNLGGTRAYEPQIRASLVTTAHFCGVVVLKPETPCQIDTSGAKKPKEDVKTDGVTTPETRNPAP